MVCTESYQIEKVMESSDKSLKPGPDLCKRNAAVIYVNDTGAHTYICTCTDN